MIDTHAVLAQTDTLLKLLEQNGGNFGEISQQWLEAELQPFAVQRIGSPEGGPGFLMPGRTPRVVALGTSTYGPAGSTALGSSIGLAIMVETLKALVRRFEEGLPCGLMLYTQEASSGKKRDDSAQREGVKFAAHLELLVAIGAAGQGSGVGLLPENQAGSASAPHPRLVALADEAIRELTGISAALPVQAPGRDTSSRDPGVPSAAIVVQLAQQPDEELGGSARLSLLQAAECFGRWAEATVHLLAGDEVDLWAREHRLPAAE